MMKRFVLIFALLLTACQSERQSLAEPMEPVGTWVVNNDTIELDSDGTATRTRTNQQTEGSWETLEEQVWVFWPDGWIDLIEPQGDGYIASSFGPDTKLSADPDRTAKAIKG